MSGLYFILTDQPLARRAEVSSYEKASNCDHQAINSSNSCFYHVLTSSPDHGGIFFPFPRGSYDQMLLFSAFWAQVEVSTLSDIWLHNFQGLGSEPQGDLKSASVLVQYIAALFSPDTAGTSGV